MSLNGPVWACKGLYGPTWTCLSFYCRKQFEPLPKNFNLICIIELFFNYIYLQLNHQKHIMLMSNHVYFFLRNNIQLSRLVRNDPINGYVKKMLFRTFFLTFCKFASESHKNTFQLTHVVGLDILLSLIEDAC